ncbi:FHA domain-containing protein [Streptomyces sp. XM4193]|uniref:FHA domain-containing protein n=1 Tax=Streptomyces sp. XM4193 TaxID=2929782 RepID=UPI001FF92974|nr:FHA domain-containing protein [Streptomyces sp. XM4193]MCK1795536.1 FHA domain-containing protein [Streptomyces sp. XM4193]
MISIIVVPGGKSEPRDQIRLAPGQRLDFGREPGPARGHTSSASFRPSAPLTGGTGRPGHTDDRTADDRRTDRTDRTDRQRSGPEPERPGPDRSRLALDHEGVSRLAGTITATGSFWSLSNLSRHQTYVVENPEGAGEHIKIPPGRLEAPVPFEFSRVVVPARDRLVTLDVWAPRHEYADSSAEPLPGGQLTAPAFPLDRSKRYFLVLVALCEQRLRGAPHAPLPTTGQVAERLGTVWPAAGRTSVQWNIDYLAVKLRIKPGPESVDGGGRLNGKKETLVSLALRFDLVREDDLALLGRKEAG